MERKPFDLRWLKSVVQKATEVGVTELELTLREGPLRRIYVKLEPSDKSSQTTHIPKLEILEQSPYEDETRYHHLKSPFGGIFYRRPQPGMPPFVAQGDVVEVGQPVGIIEAMKIFNEVATQIAGTIVQIRAEEGKIVDQDATLLIIDKTQTQADTPPRI